MIVIILGPPASGKGTQAELLAEKLQLYHFQTGNLSRKLAKKNKRIREINNSGKLIPEDEMTMYVIEELTRNLSHTKDILFEGFPRFISQYNALDNYLNTKGDDIDAVINLKISQDEAIKRITSRRICEKCGTTYNLQTNPPNKTGICDKCGGNLIIRKDDNPKSIKTRFEYYHENTKELTDLLQKKGLLIDIDAARPINEIHKDILQKIKK